MVATAVFAARPRYETLYRGLSEQDQEQVAGQLQSVGIDAHYDKPGEIEVPAGRKAEAWLKLAEANKQPRSQGQWDLGQLNNMPFGTTPQVEQERLKAIAEGEIAKSIETMDGVESARVHLTLPSQSLFVTDQKTATASVSIVESGSADINQGQGHAIAMLVSNAVQGLDPKDVVVVNQHLQTIWNGQDQADGSAGGAERKNDIEEEVSRRRTQEIQQMLDAAYGAGAAIVTVHADVDMDPSHTITTVRKPTGAAATQSSSESVSGGNKGGGGIPGQLQPPGGATAPGAAGTNAYTGTTDTKEMLASETQTDTTKAIGTVTGMAVNVVVDSAKIQNPKEVRDIVVRDLGNKIQLDKAGDPLPGKFTVGVTPVEFDKTAAKEATAAAASAASQARIQQIISMLPIAALLAVAALVLKAVAKFAKTQLGSPVTGVTPEGLTLSAGVMAALPDGGGAGGGADHLIAKLQSSAPREDEPPLEIDDIKDRVHIPLEQLKKMAAERPSTVAMLIKSMILEEKR